MYSIDIAIDEAMAYLSDASDALDIALTELLGKSEYALEADITNVSDQIDELLDQLDTIQMNR